MGARVWKKARYLVYETNKREREECNDENGLSPWWRHIITTSLSCNLWHEYSFLDHVWKTHFSLYNNVTNVCTYIFDLLFCFYP